MMYPKPTPELIAKTRRLWDMGYTQRAIGIEVGREHTWVSNMAHRRGWPKRKNSKGVNRPKSLTVRCAWCYAHVTVPYDAAIPERPHLCHRRAA